MKTIGRYGIDNNKWLIVTDLDGTLLDDEGKPTKYNIEVIKKMIELGHKICIVTGRPWRATKDIYEEIGLNTILANYNGGLIHNPLDPKRFQPVTITLSHEITKQFLQEEFISNGVTNFAIESQDKLLIKKHDKWIESYFHISDAKQQKINVEEIDLNFEKIDFNPNSILLKWENPKLIDDIKSFIQTNYGYAFTFRMWPLKRHQNKVILIEINPKISTKGFALKYLASHYNIPINFTMAFGDNLNDREMLLSAGWGIAMKNATYFVKDLARAISKYSNSESGVAHFLDNFFELGVDQNEEKKEET